MDIEETTKYITDRIFYITYKSPKVVPKVPLKDLVPYDRRVFRRKGFSVLHVFFILIAIKRIILRFLLSYNQIWMYVEVAKCVLEVQQRQVYIPAWFHF